MTKTIEQIITDLREGNLLTDEELEFFIEKARTITSLAVEMGSYGLSMVFFLNSYIEAAESMLTWRKRGGVNINRVNGEIETQRNSSDM